MRKLIKLGTKVDSRFGEGKVVGIALCEREGEKEGIAIDKVWIDLKDRCVFDLDNGHWCYGYQITPSPVKEKEAIYV
jgi:hypothetical protein